MSPLYSLLITSTNTGSGKTSTAVALASALQDKGKKIAFIKPVAGDVSGQTTIDPDVVSLKQLLNQEESALSLRFTDTDSLKTGLKNYLSRSSSGKDVMIMESSFRDLTLNFEIADFIQAGILGIEGFQPELTGILNRYQELGSCLLGVIINKVPVARIKQVQEIALKSGVKVAGVIPENRSLSAVTIRELAEGLNGKIIGNRLQLEESIESIMVGVLNPDHGAEYYSRKVNKAVIVSAERVDMQLSALTTPSACLVLAGSKPPVPVVVNRAEAKQVPVISVNQGIPEILTGLEDIFRKNRFNVQKASLTFQIFRRHVDFSAIYQPMV